MTKREKRLRDLRNKIARTEAQREAAIKMLVKAVTILPTLRKQEARMSAGWHRKERPDWLKQVAPMGMVNDGEPVYPLEKKVEAEATVTAPAAQENEDDGLGTDVGTATGPVVDYELLAEPLG